MANFVELTAEPLDVAKIHAAVIDVSTGAASLFVGTTRDRFEGRKVVQLEYEAYKPMALKMLNQLCALVRSKWPQVRNVAVYHRLGVVEQKEASIVIAVSSPHRKDALEAVAFAIDELKATVPIWKKEIYEDGSEWKENAECGWMSEDAAAVGSSRVDPSMIQIKATDEEVERRIESFISRKREDVNASNVLEFCSRHASDEPDGFSCARTDSVLVRKKDSLSHLRRSNVENLLGPCDSETKVVAVSEAVEERLRSLEDHVDVVAKPVPQDVYLRLKDIENRVLFLEGLSPEYFSISDHNKNRSGNLSNAVDAEETQQQIEYKETLTRSLTTINNRIQELQSKLLISRTNKM